MKVGDLVYLKAVSFKGSRSFSKKKKLSTKYVRPNKLLERVGAVAYKLDLPPKWTYFIKKFMYRNLGNA